MQINDQSLLVETMLQFTRVGIEARIAPIGRRFAHQPGVEVAITPGLKSRDAP